jgi:multiple sugar transport system permease protein
LQVKRNTIKDYNFSWKKLFIHKLTTKHFWSHVVLRIGFYILLCDLAFVFIFPFIHMIITSLKSPSDLVDITVKWLPNSLDLDNYRIAFNALAYKQYFINSVIITTLGTLGHVLACSFIAYGFARYDFPGKNILFPIVIFTLIVPIQSIIFPLYIQYSKLGWLNTYIPLTLPTYFGFGLRGGLFIFLYRQFFMGLPYEMEEAARIDGCGSFSIFWRIVLPISKSSMLVSTVLSMVWHWNDYFEPSIYLTKPLMSMLPSRLPGLYSMLSAEQVAEQLTDGSQIIYNEAMVLAATFLVIVPILIVYSILQRKFMEGVERSGLTGQ